MLTISFALLSLTVALGALFLTGRAFQAALVHGGAGAAGLATLGLALRAGHLHGQFAWTVFGLLAAALCGGITLAVRGRSALVVFLHAMAGGVAYLLLAGLALG